MKRLLIKLASVAAFALTGMTAAQAAECTSGSTIESLGTCEFGGLTFSAWSLSEVPLNSVQVFFGQQSNFDDNWVNVSFQLTGGTGGGGGVSNPDGIDALVQYSVSAGAGTSITGIDLALGSAAGFVTIIEDAYSDAARSVGIGECFVQNGGTESCIDYFDSSYSQIWISKDVNIGSPTVLGSLSDFTNSHHYQRVPEPASLALLGLGIVGLGALQRRRRQV